MQEISFVLSIMALAFSVAAIIGAILRSFEGPTMPAWAVLHMRELRLRIEALEKFRDEFDDDDADDDDPSPPVSPWSDLQAKISLN